MTSHRLLPQRTPCPCAPPFSCTGGSVIWLSPPDGGTEGFIGPGDSKPEAPSFGVASISVPLLPCKPPRFSVFAPLEASPDCCVFVSSRSSTSEPGVRSPATGTVGGLPPDLGP